MSKIKRFINTVVDIVKIDKVQISVWNKSIYQ
jgi:hypothetical protein